MDPDRSELFERYLTTALAQRSDVSPEGLAKSSQAYEREFGALLPDEADASILEIGCGAGGFLDFLGSRGFRDVQGVELSSELVDLCHQRGHETVVCAGGAEFLRDTSARFDAVVLIDVLEHLPKQEGVDLLKLIQGRLRPGGRVLLRVPNMSNPLNLQARYGDFTHEVGFSREALEQVLRITGFEVTTVHGATSRHRNWFARWFFDRALWWAFRQFCRRTMQIRAEVSRGKNLIAVGTIAAN